VLQEGRCGQEGRWQGLQNIQGNQEMIIADVSLFEEKSNYLQINKD